MRNTTRGNTDIRCYIVRLPEAISLKLQESNFLLYATRFSIMRSLVKRLGMGLELHLRPSSALALADQGRQHVVLGVIAEGLPTVLLRHYYNAKLPVSW
jgi:hypothetical protein